MSLFGPSNSDIQAFKNRLNRNPVVDAVVTYIQRSPEVYSIAVTQKYILLESLYAFHNGTAPLAYYLNSPSVFLFSTYGMKDIPHIKYQEAVADVIKQRISSSIKYKNVKVFQYFKFEEYDTDNGYRHVDNIVYGFRNTKVVGRQRLMF